MGITVFVARIVDSDFRKSFKSLVYPRIPKPRPLVSLENSSQEDSGFSVNFDRVSLLLEGSRHFEIFKSLHVKVPSQQFILDSLISLSFNFARLRQQNHAVDKQ